MANWAYTDYVIEGSKESLDKINDALLHPAERTEGGSEDWEGYVLKKLGIKWEDRQPDGSGYYIRGFVQKDTIEYDGELIKFSAEEAWGATDFNEVLEKNIPDVKVFYFVVEEGEGIYATNDKECKYFTARIYVDTCIDGDYDSDYFTTEESALEWLSRKTDGRVKTRDDIDRFNSDYEDSGWDENYISFHKIAVID